MSVICIKVIHFPLPLADYNLVSPNLVQDITFKQDEMDFSNLDMKLLIIFNDFQKLP